MKKILSYLTSIFIFVNIIAIPTQQIVKASELNQYSIIKNRLYTDYMETLTMSSAETYLTTQNT